MEMSWIKTCESGLLESIYIAWHAYNKNGELVEH